MPIYGGSPDAVAAYDRFREGLGAQQAQFLPQQALAAVRELEDRRSRERQYQFALAKQAEDLAYEQERMKLEREKLNETIRANKRAEDFNFKQLEQPRTSASERAAETAANSRLAMEELKQADAARQQYMYGQNLSDLLNQFEELPATEAAMSSWLPAVEKRTDELDTDRLGFGRWRSDAERMALDEMRNKVPFNVPIDVSEGSAKEIATRGTTALSERRRLLEDMIDSGMRQSGDLVRQRGRRWEPSVAAPPQFRFVQKATDLAQQQQALTTAIDQVEGQIPSFLAAPPELHPQIKEARKQGKDLLRNLSTEKKDIEKQLADLEKEAEAQAEKEKEKSTQGADVSQFNFKKLSNFFNQFDTESDARAAGKASGDIITLLDPVTGTYRRARLR